MESRMLAASIISAPQLMLLAGFILLGWALMRHRIASQRKIRRETNSIASLNKQQERDSSRSMPLADAPVETQRWQVAMFDLQRELKAELDTRIAIVDALLRQVDTKIARLESLQQNSRD